MEVWGKGTLGRVRTSAARFSLGVIRGHYRVVGYAFILVTDRCPPFRLRP